MYLDLRTECSLFVKPVVAVKAFRCGTAAYSDDDDNDSDIQLVLVDAAAVIVTLRFTVTQASVGGGTQPPQRRWTPVPVPCNGRTGSVVVDVRCFVPRAAAVQAAVVSAEATICRGSMVAFVSPDVLLISLKSSLVGGGFAAGTRPGLVEI